MSSYATSSLGWSQVLPAGQPKLPQLLIRPATLATVQAEATSAHNKHGEQSMFAPGQSNERRLAVLVEEVGECARELNEAAIHGTLDIRHLREELVQVAAMATTWHDALLAEEGL